MTKRVHKQRAEGALDRRSARPGLGGSRRAGCSASGGDPAYLGLRRALQPWNPGEDQPAPREPPGGAAASPTERTELTLRGATPPAVGEELRTGHFTRLSRMLSELCGRVDGVLQKGLCQDQQESLEASPPCPWARVLSPRPCSSPLKSSSGP